MTKKALGKGLGVFMPDDYGIIKSERYAEVEIDEVVPNPLQPRMKFDSQSIEELARSIMETGVIQPILVVPEADAYKIIVGERRWRAAHKAGLKKIPVLIRQIPVERQLEISLVENLHRENLNPLEIAHVYQRMAEDLGYTQEEIAVRVGKDRTSVTNSLRLLNLPRAIQEYLAENKITMGHARALLALDNADSQIALAKEIVTRDLTVRDVEKLISGRRKRAASPKRSDFDPDLQALEEDLVRALGTKVSIAGTRKKGTIKIQYFSLDDLNRLYRKIKGGT
ncbi:MAG: ParB/RepB/Spo0J family partition protein [Candidatus Aminicenantes bacterium]|nr:ParB/RepB/Spo0J family partition protein [Candidatus Aminicenantes bacterium]